VLLVNSGNANASPARPGAVPLLDGVDRLQGGRMQTDEVFLASTESVIGERSTPSNSTPCLAAAGQVTAEGCDGCCPEPS